MTMLTPETKQEFQQMMNEVVRNCFASLPVRPVKDDYLTVEDVEHMTKFERSFIIQETKAGRLTGIWKGRQWRFKRADVHAWMQQDVK